MRFILIIAPFSLLQLLLLIFLISSWSGCFPSWPLIFSCFAIINIASSCCAHSLSSCCKIPLLACCFWCCCYCSSFVVTFQFSNPVIRYKVTNKCIVVACFAINSVLSQRFDSVFLLVDCVLLLQTCCHPWNFISGIHWCRFHYQLLCFLLCSMLLSSFLSKCSIVADLPCLCCFSTCSWWISFIQLAVASLLLSAYSIFALFSLLVAFLCLLNFIFIHFLLVLLFSSCCCFFMVS